MPNVLIIGNHDKGLYKFRKELIQELLLHDYSVTVSTPYGSYIPMLEKLGSVYAPIEYDRKSKNPIKELKLLVQYFKLIKKSKFDVVLLYTIKPVLYAGFVCKVKKIAFFPNITGLSPALTGSRILKQLCFFAYRRVLKHANMVFFQNKNNLELFQNEDVIGKNVRLLPGSGVNLEEHTYEAYSEGDKLEILYVGRITKVKGITELLESIEYLSAQSSKLVFSFLGSCDELFMEPIKQLRDKGLIVYYGEQDDPHTYMKKAQAVIMPSYGEGMSNVLLEAAACGRPVLASDVPGCREIVLEGESGFLFEPHSAMAIVKAIRRLQELTKEQREKMGIRGREHVASYFSREIVVREYMNEIKKCVEV